MGREYQHVTMANVSASETTNRSRTAAWISVAIGVLVVAAAIVWPRVTGTEVFVEWPPLKARWRPEAPLAMLLPLAVALGGILCWRFTATLRFPGYLAAVFAGSWLWTASLAFVTGAFGISRVFNRPSEYLIPAKEISSIDQMFSGFVEHIPLDSPDNWPIHVAGHPPGATLVFVLLARIGLSDPFSAGLAVMSLGCTAVPAAVLTIKRLASENVARRGAPFLILAPYAIWMGVSADALFMAVAAWGLALLAFASTARRASRTAGYGLAAGLLLGYCVYLSYGLVLLGILALAVLYLGGRWSALPWALGGALAVAAAFTAAGFLWWEAFPVLVTRYYDGIQSSRQYGYWVWANLGAWTFTSGLAIWAAIPRSFRYVFQRTDPGRHAVAVLGWAGLAAILVATLSSMSKAEVERIWLPFTLWALILPSLLPVRWHRPLLLSQIASAIVIEFLWKTQW